MRNQPLPPAPGLRVVRQIFPGASLRCGDASVSELLRQASRGLIDVPPAGPARLRFFDEIRERGNIPRRGGSQLTGLEQAFESFVPEFRRLGLSPPRMRKLNPGSWQDELLPWLRKGPDHLALFGEFYGTFNWLIQDRGDILSGQPGLRMDHWTALKGRPTGPIQQADPLADGRRSGIARGVQEIPMTILRLSGGAWDKVDTRPIGRGRVIAGLVRVSRPLDGGPEPEPKPEPEPEPEASSERCERKLDRLRADFADLQEENEDLEARLTQWREWVGSHPDDPTSTGAEDGDPTGVDPGDDG